MAVVSKFVFGSDFDPGRDRGGAGAGPAAHQEQVQSAVREGAEGPGDGAVPLQRIPGVGHRTEGSLRFFSNAAVGCQSVCPV